MAENLNALVVTRVTCRFLDFGANIYSAGAVEPSSIAPVLATSRQYERVNRNTSAGEALYATIDAGISKDGVDISPVFIAADPNNTTDPTLKELLIGLHDNNLTTKTGYAAWNVVSALTGGGKQECQFELTVYDNEGGANIATMNVAVKELPPMAAQGLHFGFTPVLNVVGAIVWS